MKAGGGRGLPIFWQMLLLLLAGLMISQATAWTLLFTVRPPRPEVHRLSELAETLAGQPVTVEEGATRLQVTTVRQAPEATDGMTMDPASARLLAQRLEVAPSRVRLFRETEVRSLFGVPLVDQRRGGGSRGRRLLRRGGEPIFFNRIVVAVERQDGWHVAQSPPAPWISPWQRRTILWFVLSALASLPFVWMFARALSRPIRAFAAAADQLGEDPLAPAVPEAGPAELRTTARALNRMQSRLADYVEERTAMIGAIAHDLRTPLARIAFRIEGAPDPLREKVQADIEQMRAMISATIGFVRNAARVGERKPVDLFALLRRLAAQEGELGREVTVTGDGPLVVEGDPLALARLFQNLIDNGIAYGKRVAITMQAEGRNLIVSVADEGPGVPVEMVDRLFQPFERGDPSRSRQTGGIGLGLTIARAIAEDHGATVTLRNRAEGGLEARCTFKRALESRVEPVWAAAG